MSAAEAIVAVAAFYTIAGFCFGLWFVFRAAQRLDPAARDSGRTFRLIILPGSMALWPLLAARLRSLP
jgi:hypothetical protein